MWKVVRKNGMSMDKFEGFTDEEIQSITSPQSKNISDEKCNHSTAVYKNVQIKNRYQNRLPRKNVARERLLLKGNYNTFSCLNDEILPKEARLNITKIPEEEEFETDETKMKNVSVLKTDTKTDSIQNADLKTEIKTDSIKNEVMIKEENEKVPFAITDATKSTVVSENVNCKPKSSSITEVDSEESIKPTTHLHLLNSENAGIDALKQFENRQKLLEEHNRQRKEILKKALADRAKKTHEEAKRLNEIEGELKKLDLLLSNDVAIIRNQIETASIDFMEAQKRYDRAEKEFLDAKLDLFNKKERKELLTSHLCTIIEQNEMRKAKKLSDLMMQLEIGPKTSLITSQIKVEYKDKQQEEDSILANNDQEKENF